MKITTISDLHLEFCAPCDLPGGDLLLMAGDIFGAAALDTKRTDADSRATRKRQEKWCAEQLSKYPRVLYVVGNHEHYGSVFEETVPALEDWLAERAPQVTLLDNALAEIDGVAFLGTTLWAKHGVENGESGRIGNAMRDFTAIRTLLPPPPGMALLQGRRAFRPEDAYNAHQDARRWLEKACPTDKPVVLITHHAPSFQSAHGEHYGSPYLDDAYAANLVDFLLTRPNIKLAIHGHTHHDEHYRIGDTLVIANPRGYFPNEPRSKFFDAMAEDIEFADLFKERLP